MLDDGRAEVEQASVAFRAHVDAGAFNLDRFLAHTSRVAVTLQTDARLADPEATGDPLDAGNARVVLVGEGMFGGGSLDGGRLALVLDARTERVEDESEAR